jgi:hypothetical protein
MSDTIVESSSDRRGQMSIELIISFMFLVLTLGLVILLAIDKTSESAEMKTYLDVKRIGESIKDNINTVSQQGPGYYRYFRLPSRIKGDYDYNVSVYGNDLYITWNHRLSPFSTQLVTANVSIINLKKGLSNRNCVFNDDGVVKIKQLCGKVSVLVYEGLGGRDRLLLNNIAGSCKLHVENTSDDEDLTKEKLGEYDILWLGYNSVSGVSYTLDGDAENAIKQFVLEGGLVWSSSQEDTTWGSGWLPYTLGVNGSGDQDVDPTAKAGSFFNDPNTVNPDDLVMDENFINWDSKYTVLAIKEGESDIAHFLRLDHGSGMYLLSNLDVRDSMPDYDGNNTLLFMNALNYLTPYSKC